MLVYLWDLSVVVYMTGLPEEVHAHVRHDLAGPNLVSLTRAESPSVISLKDHPGWESKHCV